MSKRSFTYVTLVFLTAFATAVMVATPAVAQAPRGDFPTRPITFVVGFAPGGGADVFARALAEAANDSSRSPGGREPARSWRHGRHGLRCRPAGDGYTILFGHAGSTIITPTITNQPAAQVGCLRAGGPDPRRGGVAPRSIRTPRGRRSTRSRPTPRRNPKKVRVAGSAIGGIDSFVVLSWEKAASIDVEYIPHEGGGPATLAFLGKNAEAARRERLRGEPARGGEEDGADRGREREAERDISGRADAQGEGLGRRDGPVAERARAEGHAGAPRGVPGRGVPEGDGGRFLEDVQPERQGGRRVPGSGRLPDIPGRRGRSLREDHRPAGPQEEVVPLALRCHSLQPTQLATPRRPVRSSVTFRWRGGNPWVLARVLLPEPGRTFPRPSTGRGSAASGRWSSARGSGAGSTRPHS